MGDVGGIETLVRGALGEIGEAMPQPLDRNARLDALGVDDWDRLWIGVYLEGRLGHEIAGEEDWQTIGDVMDAAGSGT